MEKVPTTLDAIELKARHKKTGELCSVLLICFVNRYIDVLPERNLEGGEQESWNFGDFDIFAKL